MIKYIFVPMIILALTACNKEDDKSSVAKTEGVSVGKVKEGQSIKEPAYPIVDNRFNKLKSVTLEFLSKREDLLKKEKLCVNNAKTREEIKSCLSDANVARKNVGEEIKKKKEEVNLSK